MKIKDLFPTIPQYLKESQRLSDLANMIDVQKSQGEVFTSPTIGTDQLVSVWMRQSQVMPYRRQLLADIYYLATSTSEVRSPIQHITSEVFRRGIHWRTAFSSKCLDCGAEYQENIEECDVCKSRNLRKPDIKQRKRFEKFFDDVNIFDNSLKEVLKVFNFNLGAIDDAFLYLAKEYYSDERSDKVRSKVLEIRNIHPADMEFDLDINGLPKNSHFSCYIHRNFHSPQTEPGFCEECGRRLVAAMFILSNRGKKFYLFDSEVIKVSRMMPNELYGISPVLTIMQKALTIMGMDSSIYRYFYERKMPASMLMVFTDDPDSIRRERANIQLETRRDPNYIPMVAVSSKGQRGRVDMVRLFHTLQEMEYLPVRQEIRERIAEMWGVTPIWSASPEALGGLSSQSQQLVVMSRVVESFQEVYHDKVFPQLLKAFGITDWELYLPNPEEKSEQTRIAFAQQRVAIAQQLSSMGFNVEISSPHSSVDEIDFVISGKPINPQQSMFGAGPEAEPPPLALSTEKADTKSRAWLNQIVAYGHVAPQFKTVGNDGKNVYYTFDNKDYIASFDNVGKLIKIQEITMPRPIKSQPVKVVYRDKMPDIETIEDDEEWDNT